MWGISPHANMLFGVESETPSDTVNILLICPSDPRSVIATIAEASAKGNASALPELRFYIVEERPEVLARHFLLLHVFFDEKLPIRHRAVSYLEIFGNSLIQEKTAAYLEDKGMSLVDFVLDGKEQPGMEEVFDLSLLKQRDLDDLADVFTLWRACKESNVKELRDETLRSFYSDRYDCREGAIDWDYHTQVRPYASIIHPIQFREWRLSGKAFGFGGATYDSDNRSLVDPDLSTSFARTGRADHTKMDVVTGPYFSCGIACDRSNLLADGLFEIHNKGTGAEQHRYSATDVALYNITRFMWQARTGEEYQMKLKGDVMSGSGEADQSDESPAEKLKFSVVPVRDIRKIFNKRKFSRYFHSVFVSHGASSILQDEGLCNILKGNATMVIETCRFDLSKNESSKQELIKSLRDVLSNAKAIETDYLPNSFGDSLLTFKFHLDDETTSSQQEMA